jgi:1-acylglycerone phosphate reductase
METLRFEMQPFRVTVFSVVTGAVQAEGNLYFEDWKLPQNSLFKPIEAIIAARAQGHVGVKRTDRTEFADKVASEIIRGASGKMWCGANAGGVKFGESFKPQSLMVSVLHLRNNTLTRGFCACRLY